MSIGKTLLLIDGHALAFREFYALERTGMHTSEGTPTWAVFGFFKTIFDLLKKDNFAIDALAVTFDVSHHTFRTECYEEYKANREKMPDDMSIQMELIYEGLEAFNIPIYKKEGFEADDVIGTISKKAVELGHKTLILTGDKDSFQLVDKEGFVKVIIPYNGELLEYGWDKVYKKLSVYPNQVVDYKALNGDNSDNIPGVKGIGEKTATMLLAEYGTLENIYKNIENISSKQLKNKLINGKEMAYKSQYLATILRDVDIDFDFENTCIEMPDMSKVRDFLTKYQLLSFLKNINNLVSIFGKAKDNCESKKPQTSDQLSLFGENAKTNNSFEWFKDKIDVTVLDNEEKFNNFCNEINNSKGFFFKTAADTSNILNSQIKYMIFGLKEFAKSDNRIKFNGYNDFFAKIFIMPVNNSQIPSDIKKIFEDENIAKFTSDVKNEHSILKTNGCELKNVVFDLILANYLENTNAKNDLEIQALQFFKISPMDDAEYIGISNEIHNEYKAQLRDMWLIMRLTEYHYQNISDTNMKILKDIELPVAKVLSYMELNGVAVDIDYLDKISLYFAQKIRKAEKKIFEIAGEVFNVKSPAQVGKILFETLQLPNKKHKRGSSNYSTNAAILEELAENYEIARCILEHRKYSKLISTYTIGLTKLVNPTDQRIHTTYNQTVAVTGRLSSSNPNMQNIPIRTEEGEKIRAAFIPQDRNNKIISADYSQIELRILAHISQDKNLIEAFKNNVDIHALTASKVYEIPVENVTKKMRSRAKAVNFGIVYGQTIYGLAKALSITTQEASIFIDKYFKTYPSVKKYMYEITQQVEKDGFVETIWGRKRYFKDEINSSNRMIREFAIRAAINFPMQGTAADLMKLAMIKFYNSLIENNLKSKLIIQVHDEMVVETYNDEIDKVKELLKQSMEFDNLLSVPLQVDISQGDTWKFAE